MTGAQFAFYLLPVMGPISFLVVDVGSVPGRRLGVGESVFRTAKMSESASWLPLVSVVPECQSEW